MSFSGTPFYILIAFLLIAFAIGTRELYRWWRYRKIRAYLMSIAGLVTQANEDFGKLTENERYFAYQDERLYFSAYGDTRKGIYDQFQRLRLPVQLKEALLAFCQNLDQCAEIRKNYNDRFVRIESEKYKAFFENLERYPLSEDQVDAIIRDEDNNLVIAGAGTGKTTTISGKVAYLLEKKLARPEELLIISFTKNAVKEMYERCQEFCKDNPQAKQIEVRTFNSFGFLVSRICSSRELLLAFDGNEEKAKTFLQEKFDHLFINDRDFHRKAVNFLGFFNRPERNEFEFESKNDYLTYEQGFDHLTLDGVKVNSKEEVEIANFFCLHGVSYEYQKHYPLKPEDRNAVYGAYQPDFYLTDHDLWHEHFGITRTMDVPKWFSARPPFQTARDYYNAGIAWKEGIHLKYGTKLIKTFSYEKHEGILIPELKQKLGEHGVEFKERSPEEMLELIRKSGQYAECMVLIFTFLGLMKSNGRVPDELRHQKGDKRFKVFLDVFKPLFKTYNDHLESIPAVDYNDMVNHAAKHFRNGAFHKLYKYILIDEFQDMSLGRYELIKAIRAQNPGAKLYAVGDDWQSIFRFTGSDLSIITQFEKHFGFTSFVPILKTYRFNQQILEASSAFIQKNPVQIRKKLTALQVAPEGHKSFAFLSNNRSNDVLRDVLQEIGQAKQDARVFLIGRYKGNIPNDLSGIRKAFPGLEISYHTAHGSKGMTCDYAVLLDVNAGILGFPSEMADDPILNYVLQEGDEFENAEERRVFYVAITRARVKNYLLYNENQPSKFLIELRMLAGLETNDQSIKCPECGGQLLRRIGPHSEFYGCVHYPRCNGKVAMGR